MRRQLPCLFKQSGSSSSHHDESSTGSLADVSMDDVDAPRRLLNDADLDLVDDRERQAYYMLSDREYAHTREYSPELLKRIGVENVVIPGARTTEMTCSRAYRYVMYIEGCRERCHSRPKTTLRNGPRNFRRGFLLIPWNSHRRECAYLMGFWVRVLKSAYFVKQTLLINAPRLLRHRKEPYLRQSSSISGDPPAAMDLGKSTSTSATLKKLQEEGALPGREKAEREAAVSDVPEESVSVEEDSEAFAEAQGNGEKFVGVAGESIASGFEGEIMMQERCTVWYTSGQSKTIRIAVPAVMGELSNVATSLKEKVVQEASDAATTSGGKTPTKARKFLSVLGNRRKAETPLASDVFPPPARRQRIVTVGEKEAKSKAARGKSGGTSSASAVTASTDVVPVVGSREATPSGSVGDPVGGRGLSEAVLTWEELHVEMGRLLEAGARGVGCEVSEVRAETVAANARAERPARELAEAREDLTKMRELVAGNECQRKGLEDCMSELGITSPRSEVRCGSPTPVSTNSPRSAALSPRFR
uniref:Uncharacterized protein n=2 Tax=Oryza sativa subsp. japonica TaxID=39947 RepID=Q8LMJ7_ORYSJ|nr:Hypothetical protein [Oryza sativa Japonica Group]ABG65939.1 hypothetical protein LOC_Os10g09529 [Oryza sativa Japonica Group]